MSFQVMFYNLQNDSYKIKMCSLQIFVLLIKALLQLYRSAKSCGHN